MNVKIMKEAKRHITLADMPAVKELKESFKEMSKKDFISCEVQSMARIATKSRGHEFEILKFDIQICKNRDEVDAWVEAYAYNTFVGFADIGFYVSDAWSVSGDNSDEIYDRMYVRFYHQ